MKGQKFHISLSDVDEISSARLFVRQTDSISKHPEHRQMGCTQSADKRQQASTGKRRSHLQVQANAAGTNSNPPTEEQQTGETTRQLSCLAAHQMGWGSSNSTAARAGFPGKAPQQCIDNQNEKKKTPALKRGSEKTVWDRMAEKRMQSSYFCRHDGIRAWAK